MMRFESIGCFHSKVFLLSHGVFFLSSGKQLLPKTNRVFFSKKSSSAPWVPSLCRGCCPWSLDKFPSRTDLIARQSECVDPLTIAQHFQHMHSVPSSQFPSQKIAHLNPKPKTKPNPKPPKDFPALFHPSGGISSSDPLDGCGCYSGSPVPSSSPRISSGPVLLQEEAVNA